MRSWEKYEKEERKMSESRRCFFLSCLLVMYSIVQQPMPAHADEKYPTKAIKFVVPLAAGGATDVVSRKMADLVGKALGQEIVIDNKIGAGGIVGATFLAKSKPDGYTIGGVMSSVFAIGVNFTKLDFDPLGDLVPLLQWFSTMELIQVKADSPMKTFNDFIQESRKRQLLVSTPGSTSLGHVTMQRLGVAAKLNLKLVPYDGGLPAITAAMGGQVDAAAASGNYEYIRAGKMRPIARLNHESKPPDRVPSLIESGYDIDDPGFFGMFVPKGLPDPVKKRLEEEYTKAVHNPSIVELTESTGQTWYYRNSKDFKDYVTKTFEQGRKTAKELGLGLYSKDKK